MKIFKIAVIVIIFAVFCIVGFDGIKHYIILKKIQNQLVEFNVECKSELSFNRYGFFIELNDVKCATSRFDQVITFMPWDSFYILFINGKNLQISTFKAKTLTSYLKFDEENHDVEIPYVEVDSSSILGFKISEISGSVSVNDEKLIFDVSLSRISKEHHNFFDIILKGNISHFKNKDDRKGKVDVLISNAKNLIQILQSESIINAWQKKLVSSMVTDGINLPLNIKKDNVYLGPLNIYKLPF